jgi:hypothetical protein
MFDLVPTVVVAVLGCALLLTVVVIWSIKRHREPRLRIESDAPLPELLPSLSGLTHGTALKGNAVEILENGAFFRVMFEDRGHSLVKAFACDACWVRVSVGSAGPARDAVDAG